MFGYLSQMRRRPLTRTATLFYLCDASFSVNIDAHDANSDESVVGCESSLQKQKHSPLSEQAVI